MTVHIKYTCDGCQGEIDTSDMPHIDVHGSPGRHGFAADRVPHDQVYHFCGLKCLRTWTIEHLRQRNML